MFFGHQSFDYLSKESVCEALSFSLCFSICMLQFHICLMLLLYWGKFKYEYTTEREYVSGVFERKYLKASMYSIP